MYDEKRESFSIKDIILQLLFIVLLVFILIWLFPTKGYLDKKLDGVSSSFNNSLKPLYTRLFTDNILTMKEAAKNYYTTPRLPHNVGDKVTMTLGEMYNKGLLLELVDSNNTACDKSKSSVELTKMEDEYQLKTTLSCSDKEAFVIEYLGCYDYCEGKLCSKAQTVVTQSGTVVTVPGKTPAGTPQGTPVVTEDKKYKYQYVLTTGGTCNNYGSWSDWTVNKIEENPTTKVDTKTEKVFDHYDQVYDVVDTKYVDQTYNENVVYKYSTRTLRRTSLYNFTTKTTASVVPYTKTTTSNATVIPYSTRTLKKTSLYDYTTKSVTEIKPYTKTVTTKDTVVPYSVQTVKKTVTYAYSYKKVASGSNWVSAGRAEYNHAVCSGSCTVNGVKYTYVSTRKELDCSSSCRTVNYYTYDLSKQQTTYKSEKYCAKGTDTGSGCVVVTYEKRNICTKGKDNGKGCLVTANNTILSCKTGTDNGTGCAVTTSKKYCAKGTDTGKGCQVVTYRDEKYCAQGTDNGSGCSVAANRTILSCPQGTDNGSGCTIYNKSTYCAQGTPTASGCQVVTYRNENYCAKGTDNGSGCVATVAKTKKVAQLIYGYKNGDAIYKNVTYYRAKTKSCTDASTDYQWSESDNDSALKAKGYTLTGVTEQIK